MTTLNYTPGPWQGDLCYIVAPDPEGIHPDIYIAEIAETDSDGRIAAPEQQIANRQLIAAAPEMCDTLLDIKRLAEKAGGYEAADPFVLLELIAEEARSALAVAEGAP